jgi:hypothetical protein
MRYYCTLFDRNYLSRGLALHGSLERHGGDFRLFILCPDSPTFNALSALALPHVELIPVDMLEDWDRELQASRSNRSAPEYYFTCKPVLLRYVFANFSGVDRLTYLDSDLYFFADPSPVEQEEAGSAVTLTPHRFPPRLAFMKRSGEFNAGWVGVSAAPEGRRFLEWWRARCIEWCRVVFEETRFGDQKYLEQVPGLFRDVVSISHLGVNAAPWNIDGLRIDASGTGVRIEGSPLIAFHFHGMKRVALHLYDSGLLTYRARLTDVVRNNIFRPYLQELSRCEIQLSGLPETIRLSVTPALTLPGGNGWGNRMKVLARIVASRTALVGP